jgi:15-cis-phytoene synthase
LAEPAEGAALDRIVRRADEDRWLASRFAPAPARRRLLAFYALDAELARIRGAVSELAAGAIRFAWWRDSVADIHAGRPAPRHPALIAYAHAHAQTPFSEDIIQALIAARARELEAAPLASAAQRGDYVEAVAGGMMRLAACACATPAPPAFVRGAAPVWGAIHALRRGLAPGRAGDDVLQQARADYAALRAGPRLPAALFPALGYVALAPLYFRALARGGNTPLLLQRQLRLIAAAARGRV